jgi:hypothetical protein
MCGIENGGVWRDRARFLIPHVVDLSQVALSSFRPRVTWQSLIECDIDHHCQPDNKQGF